MHEITNSCEQAKLKSFHEVVVRNRLEQLRKRQRDEALQAQEELLAGVARSASKGDHRLAVTPNAAVDAGPSEVAEPYERGMSPPLLNILQLSAEEREMDIVTALEDKRNLVSASSAVFTPHA